MHFHIAIVLLNLIVYARTKFQQLNVLRPHFLYSNICYNKSEWKLFGYNICQFIVDSIQNCKYYFIQGANVDETLTVLSVQCSSLIPDSPQ